MLVCTPTVGNAEALESPQASAPTSFFSPWEKHIFTAIYEENSRALEKAVQDPNFDKIQMHGFWNWACLEFPDIVILQRQQPHKDLQDIK